MAKTSRKIVVLKNPKSGTLYYTRKNPTNTSDKLVFKKYDKVTRKIEIFKESNIKLG